MGLNDRQPPPPLPQTFFPSPQKILARINAPPVMLLSAPL